MTPRLLAMLLIALSAGAAGARGTHEFVWMEAQTGMSQARSPVDFSTAATVYEKLTRDGVRSGPLWYNLGTARLLAEDPEGALEALLRAERHIGTTPDIARNIRRATAALSEEGDDAALPWYRVPLFWHYALPCSVRAGVLGAAFSGLWMALSLRLVGARRVARSLAVVSAIALAIFGSSVAATLHAESVSDRYEELRRLQVLTESSVTADRSGEEGTP